MRFARIAKVVKLSLSPMKSIWWDHSTPAQSNNGMSNAHWKTICKATEHRQLHVLVRLHQFVQYIKNLAREDDSFFFASLATSLIPSTWLWK